MTLQVTNFDSINLPHTKIVPHFAPLREGSLKADWNDQLKQVKASQAVEPELAKAVSPEALIVQNFHPSQN